MSSKSKNILVSKGNMPIRVAEVSRSHENLFLEFTKANTEYHQPWVQAPIDSDGFEKYLKRISLDENKGYLILTEGNQDIVGVINISNIIRGHFQNAFLGYYGSQKFAGTGLMTRGLREVVKIAFTEHKLHRLEANIQPQNAFSIKLVQNVGFRKEGYSPRYLQILGIWQDHERWAMTVEDWNDACS